MREQLRQDEHGRDRRMNQRDAQSPPAHGRGYRASLTVEAGHLAFGPWVNYWRIKDSEASAGFFEPANHTREAGVEVRYRF